MRSLLQKPVADRVLRSVGIKTSELVLDERGQIYYTKGRTFVAYGRDPYGTIWVVCDIALRDVVRAYDIVIHEYVTVKQVESWEFESHEIRTIHYQGYELPVYVLVLDPMESIPPGHVLHGSLKAACAYGASLWKDLTRDRIQLATKSQMVGVKELLAETAERFWAQVKSLSSLAPLHDTADFCITQGAYQYYPVLSAGNFILWQDQVIPLGAVVGLSVYSIILGLTSGE
jgi:hypothetical protein